MSAPGVAGGRVHPPHFCPVARCQELAGLETRRVFHTCLYVFIRGSEIPLKAMEEGPSYSIRLIVLRQPPRELTPFRTGFRAILEYMAHERDGVVDIRFRPPVS